jgi:uncharacterized caspase-like protein
VTTAARDVVDDDVSTNTPSAVPAAESTEPDMVQRKALIVGIDHYLNRELPTLSGCVADAEAMEKLLRAHADGRPNYDCQLHCDVVRGTTDPITRGALRRMLSSLFTNARGELLLFFAGHGALTETGGYLCTADGTYDDWGVSMDEVLQLAGRCEAANVVILLDCCHSGSLGNPGLLAARGSNALALIRENVTIMAASRDVQVAAESEGRGAFTRSVTDALSGGAADMLGLVTAPGIYAYAERRFGPWQQRPVYKSHATDVTVMRECAPAIERLKLAQLVSHFKAADYLYPLDPEHEPEDEHGNVTEPVNKEKVAVARLFKDYRDAGLLRATIRGEQLYWTARRGHTVELTERGREYWWLMKNGKL